MMFCGNPPFDGDNNKEIQRQAVEGKVNFDDEGINY